MRARGERERVVNGDHLLPLADSWRGESPAKAQRQRRLVCSIIRVETKL